MAERTIIHVDMDAFFASVEQQDAPKLRGKPVLVSGSTGKRGVVAAVSYEARPYGVKSGMPLLSALRRCPHAVVVKAEHRKYSHISRQILDILKQFTPLVEPFSIDEAFLDVSGCQLLWGSPQELAILIKERVRESTGLTCSIGIAPNRLLAKMAATMMKPDGMVTLTMADVPDLLWPLPIEKLYGVGESTAQRLRKLGISTIGALARAPHHLLIQQLGPNAARWCQLAQGQDDTPVQAGVSPPKSISHEATLIEDLIDPQKVRTVILELCEKVGRRCRQQGMSGRTVELKLRNPQFKTITRSRTLPAPTALTDDLYEVSLDLLSEHWSGFPLRLIGVGLSQLIRGSTQRQLQLTEEDRRYEELTKATDAIKDRFGENAVTRARLVKNSEGDKS